MRLILHIGSPKTGSTSIQRFFSDHAAELRERGLVYPGIESRLLNRRFYRQAGFRFAMSRGIDNPGGLANQFSISTRADLRQFSKAYIAHLDEIFNLEDAETVVISDEALYRFSSETLACNTKDFVTTRFDDVGLVVYLKPYDVYLQSFYSQYIRMGGTLGFSGFVREEYREALHAEHLRYWIKYFGKESVSVVPQVLGSVAQEDVVADFLSRMEIEDLYSGEIRENQSLGVVGCEVLRLVNKHYIRRGEKRPNYFRQLVQREVSQDEDSFFATNAIRELEAAFAMDLAELEAMLEVRKGSLEALRCRTSERVRLEHGGPRLAKDASETAARLVRQYGKKKPQGLH